MGETMQYPKTPAEFIENYSFKDVAQVYTNGSKLVPVFRVEQMLEHYFNLVEVLVMNDDLISLESNAKNIDKVRVSRAEIVVHGTKEKPYYEIEYFDLSDNEMHIGYSSYKLDIVFEYLEKYFDIVDEKGGLN